MAKIIRYLLILILLTLRSNAYAWSCSFTNGSDGWYLENSMVCDGIDPQVALEEHYCTWYRPNDPVCQTFIEPICVDTVEYKTENCPQNYSGGIQYSRQFNCSTQTWSDFIQTSWNCTANPPSCIGSSDSRVMACPSGYEGQITETNITSCSDPYGDPISSGWIEEQNSCVQSQTDPVSPISVTSPVNSMITDSVTAPPIDATQTNDIPIAPSTGGQPVESQIQEQLEESVEESSNTSSSDSTNSVSKVESKENQKDNGKSEKSPTNSKENQEPVNELVHGFGLVLSLDILQKPMEFYQPPLNDMFSITQEFPLEQRIIEEFYTDVFRQDYLEDYYIGNSNRSWERLRRSDILQ